MTDSEYQWFRCSQIANDCAAQFVNTNIALASMFCRIAVTCQIQAQVWQ